MSTPRESERQLDRRQLLGTSLGLAAGATWLHGCAPEAVPTEAAPAADDVLPDGVDPGAFVVHGTNPWTMETKREQLRGLITPTDKIFVRGNLPFPDASVLEDRDAWKLEIGGVGSPRTMTLADLKGLGRTTIAAVLQCSGNGRVFYEHGPSGSPWGVGAAANVVWTGVPLRTVLEAVGGPGADAKFLTATGGEAIPAGLDERQIVVERSVPLDKALADAILAWDLNSEPINLSHGGPLRLIVPGYYGVNNVKYLKRLTVAAEESDAKIQRTSYRVRPIGEKGSADQPSMWAMNVKSWIESPLGAAHGDGPVAAGQRQITGVAFSGEAPIESVEVSTDGGASWSAATLVGPDLGRYAWRQFALPWSATPGTHTLCSRAKDASGKVQPENRMENERGYAHNGWRDPGVTVEVV
ncbi:MAG: sulfite oxidase [Planctomycetota bacterium]